MITGFQIIAGNFTRAGELQFRAANPSTGESMEPYFCDATSQEINVAFEAAAESYGEYCRTKPGHRAEFLDLIGEEILGLGDILIRRCHEETGLPESRLIGERARTVNQLKLFADVVREGSWVEAKIDTALPERTPVPKPDIRRMLIPLGPVGVFGASNFPLAFSVAGGDTAAALAAGCPVVVKAHPAHPGTSELVAKAIVSVVQKARMPGGVFSMLHGRSEEVGLQIVTHPVAKAIGFTGSLAGGKALFDAASSRAEPIPFYAEMGSTNPVFILPGALRDRGDAIARGLVNSVTLGVGQFCTKPGLIFILDRKERETTERLLKEMSRAMSEVPAGVMLSERTKQGYDCGIGELCGIDGVSRVFVDIPPDQACLTTPALLRSTVAVFLENPRLEQEVFGPAALVIGAASREELLSAAAHLRGHLTATIHCADEDEGLSSELIEILQTRAGRVILNGYPTGVEVCPSMHHGGPFPATTDSRSTSVGTAAIARFARPVCYQAFPQEALPDELKDGNPLGIHRLLDGRFTRE